MRTTDDCIVDEGGSRQNINANDLERDVDVAPVVRAKKLNIPIPVGNMTDDYEDRVSGGYEPPVSYIRLVKKVNEAEDVMEYVLEQSDVVIIVFLYKMSINIMVIVVWNPPDYFFCFKFIFYSTFSP